MFIFHAKLAYIYIYTVKEGAKPGILQNFPANSRIPENIIHESRITEYIIRGSRIPALVST